MKWLTELFSSGTAEVVDSVGNAIDRLITSDEEKLILKNELAKSLESFRLESERQSLKYEKEITKRWLSDNDSVTTRLVRPISYMFIIALFAFVVLFDGNYAGFSVDKAYIPVIETLLATMTIAYFGSRGVEKTMKNFKADRDV